MKKSMLILLLGIILGCFSKWLDNLVINDSIWWMHLIEVLDLRNIFSEFSIWIFLGIVISIYSETSFKASLNTFLFFLGMTVSYHIYTIYFSGFNPLNYMKIWYGITLITPLLSFVCFYAKKNNFISILIIAGMMINCFNIGFIYFDFKSIIDTFIFLGTILVLHTDLKNSIINLLGGFLLTFILILIINF